MPARLIVNADDFGYFRCVSEGIAHCHSRGIVTATAVLANYPRFQDDLDLLRQHPKLDIGVHLNLSAGNPLTDRMAARLTRSNGEFPSKFGVITALIAGRISPDDVATEWHAQIQACLDAGLEPCFLNSHEHLHMWPSLFPVVVNLGREFRVPHIRISRPDSSGWPGAGALIRDLSLKLFSTGALRRAPARPARFLGMSVSGRLSEAWLEERLPHLEPDGVYELMCHPGFVDQSEVKASPLLDYHDWETEAQALTSPAVREMLDQHDIELIGYRDLDGARLN